MRRIYIDLSTKAGRLFIVGISLFGSLLLVQLGFYVLQETQVESAKKVVETILRQETNVTNTFLAARAISDLHHLNLISCGHLRSNSTQKTIADFRYQSKDCSPSFLFLNGKESKVVLSALNNENWTFSFVANNGAFFSISLWLSRILIPGLLTVLIISFLDLLKKQRESHQFLLSEKEVELEAIQSHAANQQNLAEFAQQIAHDIRSPLSVITLLSTSKSEDDSSSANLVQQAAAEIIKSAESLLAATRNESDSWERSDSPSRKLAEKSESSPCPVGQGANIISMLQSLTETKAVEASPLKKNIQFNLHVDQNFNPEEHAQFDEEPLKRSISNILNNAIDSIEETGFVSIHLSQDPNEMGIDIRDSGRGIDSDILNKLGREKISTGKKNGNGIGLLRAAQHIQKWNGQFNIYSTKGRGTTVSIRLKSL